MSAPKILSIESLMPVLKGPSEERLYDHAADFARTWIEPGADPRAQWSERVDEVSPYAVNAVYQYRTRDGGLTPVVARFGDTRRYGDEPYRMRYVPHDVLRWRTASHRAALKQRAKDRADIARRAGGAS